MTKIIKDSGMLRNIIDCCAVAHLKTVNFNSIFEDYLRSPEHLKLQSFHLPVKIRSCLAPDLLNIKGSEVHLKKTLMNLVSNAAEPQPDGGAVEIYGQSASVCTPQRLRGTAPGGLCCAHGQG
jgi:hypothetical protein